MSKINKSRATARGSPMNNLVAHAVARNTMRSHVRTVGIELFLTHDGDQAKGLLSHLAWILGMGAEISLKVMEDSAITLRQHTILRNVPQLAVNECRWRADLAELIWVAALEASEVLMAHPSTALAAQDRAERVRVGAARMDHVAGVELYKRATH